MLNLSICCAHSTWQGFSKGWTHPVNVFCLAPKRVSITGLDVFSGLTLSWLGHIWLCVYRSFLLLLFGCAPPVLQCLGSSSWGVCILEHAASIVAVCGLCCGRWDIRSQTRDRTPLPCIGSRESYPLDHQGSPCDYRSFQYSVLYHTEIICDRVV